MTATVRIATIAIAPERFSECVVALHLTISFNKFTKPIKKKILPVMDYRTVRFELVRKTPGAKYIAGGRYTLQHICEHVRFLIHLKWISTLSKATISLSWNLWITTRILRNLYDGTRLWNLGHLTCTCQRKGNWSLLILTSYDLVPTKMV